MNEVIYLKEKLKFFEIASDLNKTNSEFLSKYKLHFRGNAGSFSLVSLDLNTAECGFSGLRSKVDGESALKKKDQITKSEEKKDPEKQLQASMILHALTDGGENHYLGLPAPFDKLSFVTSELVLVFEQSVDGKNQAVCDVIAIDQDDTLWTIELKSARNLTELIRQVTNASREVERQAQYLQEIIAITLPKSHWDGKSVKKLIIWPALTSGNTPSQTEKNIQEQDDLYEICYFVKGDSYGFLVGTTPNNKTL